MTESADQGPDAHRPVTELGPRATVRSVERALAALDYLVDAAPRPVRVTDVAEHLGLSLATASRLLATLAESGYASRTTERRFTVGPRSMPLAGAWMAGLRAAAEAPVARVSAVAGESVMLAQMLGGSLVPVSWHPPAHRAAELAARLDAIGPSYPVWATATGRAMLSKVPSAQRPRMLPAEPYPRLTDRTLTTGADLLRRVREEERAGVHVERGEVAPDLWCCAVALDPGPAGEILALAVISFDEPDPAVRQRLYNALRREIREIGRSVAEARPAGG
jgi:IclR family transcriptional regulator, acetate operon repressor